YPLALKKPCKSPSDVVFPDFGVPVSSTTYGRRDWLCRIASRRSARAFSSKGSKMPPTLRSHLRIATANPMVSTGYNLWRKILSARVQFRGSGYLNTCSRVRQDRGDKWRHSPRPVGTERAHRRHGTSSSRRATSAHIAGLDRAEQVA